MATSSPEETCSRHRLYLQGSFASQEEKGTFLSLIARAILYMYVIVVICEIKTVSGHLIA